MVYSHKASWLIATLNQTLLIMQIKLRYVSLKIIKQILNSVISTVFPPFVCYFKQCMVHHELFFLFSFPNFHLKINVIISSSLSSQFILKSNATDTSSHYLKIIIIISLIQQETNIHPQILYLNMYVCIVPLSNSIES